MLSKLANIASVDARPVQKTAQTHRSSTKGKVNYVARPADGESLFLNVYTQEDHPSNLVLEETEVTVHDIRAETVDLTLQRNGFGLFKLNVPSDIDWKNKKEVEKRYYPLVQELLLEVTGGSRVHIFDHTLRLGALEGDKGKPEVTKAVTREGQPVGMAHIDYTEESGRERLDALLPDEASKLRETPFAVVQVWRPLKGPVRASPLGLVDASTVASEDLTPYTINFPGRTGYNYAVHYNQNHKWLFAEGMRTDEAYVFVCFDSRLDRARFTPHTGFQDLSVGDDAPPRESVELRSYVFWQNEGKLDPTVN